MNPSSKLSPRLNAILELVAQLQQSAPYQRIWDCCCDHGYLGIKILSENLCEKLIFVDQLPHIIEQLTEKLMPFSTGNHELIVADAGALSFDSNQRHLVMLAGVGGECSVEIVTSIKNNHPDVEIDYIFCPSSSHNALREYLAEQNFGLAFESIVCEKKRCYEILFVQSNDETNGLPRVSLTCNLWDEDNPVHQSYLSKINAPRGSKKPKRKSYISRAGDGRLMKLSS